MTQHELVHNLRTKHARAVWLLAALLVGGSSQSQAQAAQVHRIDLRILVLSAGDVGTSMLKAGLNEGLVPFMEIDLRQPGRPVIDDAFLMESSTTRLRAKFQAVALPNEAPSQLTTAELEALARFERRFGIRQFDGFVFPTPAVGLNYPSAPGYMGPLDGRTASVSSAARAGAFGYLQGPIPFEDLDPNVFESYGFLATARPDDLPNQRSFTPLVTITIPNTASEGVLLGVYADRGREQLVVTGALNEFQFQQQVLFPGILNWLTRGVHLGTERNFFSVHVDDVFLADARWSSANHCTVGDDCPASVTAPDILMTISDVDYLNAWQQSRGMYLDLAFNGAGYDQARAEGLTFPAAERLLQLAQSFRWLSHTYTHEYLGCVQDFSVTPFRCARDTNAALLWTPLALVSEEIGKNASFAALHGLPFVSNELVTGEHSGLRRTPQEPSDNPNLAPALAANGIAWIGSDNSRESQQRSVGSTLSVPRYPMNIFYNAATKAEEVAEYNYIYNASADAGSGLCQLDPSSTCIAPLDSATGFDAYIVPQETRHALLHALSNSPRPHYAHQSNLTEDRILYPVLDAVLTQYRAVFAGNAPLVNARLSELGAELQKQRAWSSAAARVTAHIEAGRLIVALRAGAAAHVPLTLPFDTAAGAGMQAYAGSRSGWTLTSMLGQVFGLPRSVGYAQ